MLTSRHGSETRTRMRISTASPTSCRRSRELLSRWARRKTTGRRWRVSKAPATASDSPTRRLPAEDRAPSHRDPCVGNFYNPLRRELPWTRLPGRLREARRSRLQESSRSTGHLRSREADAHQSASEELTTRDLRPGRGRPQSCRDDADPVLAAETRVV